MKYKSLTRNVIAFWAIVLLILASVPCHSLSAKSEQKARLFVLLPTERGVERKDFALSMDKALFLKRELEGISKNSSTPIEVYEKVKALIEGVGISLPIFEKMDTLLDEFPLYGFICLVAFFGFGMSMGLGTKFLFVGGYSILLTVGMYYVWMLERGAEEIKSAGPDIVFGLSVPFIGFLIGLSIPGSPLIFPLIVGVGFSGLTFWVPIT